MNALVFSALVAHLLSCRSVEPGIRFAVLPHHRPLPLLRPLLPLLTPEHGRRPSTAAREHRATELIATGRAGILAARGNGRVPRAQLRGQPCGNVGVGCEHVVAFIKVGVGRTGMNDVVGEGRSCACARVCVCVYVWRGGRIRTRGIYILVRRERVQRLYRVVHVASATEFIQRITKCTPLNSTSTRT